MKSPQQVYVAETFFVVLTEKLYLLCIQERL